MQRFAVPTGVQKQRRPRQAGGAVSAGDICGGMHPDSFSNFVWLVSRACATPVC